MIKVIDFQNDTNIEEEIKDALVTTGVFYLKNHGVSKELIRDLELEAKKFYSKFGMFLYVNFLNVCTVLVVNNNRSKIDKTCL